MKGINSINQIVTFYLYRILQKIFEDKQCESCDVQHSTECTDMKTMQ